MHELKSLTELDEYRQSIHEHQKIGFVPTMGHLHEGHMALVAKAQESCDVVVLSIFVNPAQFNNQQDLE